MAPPLSVVWLKLNADERTKEKRSKQCLMVVGVRVFRPLVRVRPVENKDKGGLPEGSLVLVLPDALPQQKVASH